MPSGHFCCVLVLEATSPANIIAVASFVSFSAPTALHNPMAMDLLPKVITAVILCVFYILLGLAPASAVFGGPFSKAVPWLLLGGMIISKVFEQTPLLKRFSYWLIIKLGGSYDFFLQSK